MIPKFRVWDKEERAMLDVHGINFDAHGIWTNELIDDESDGNFIFLDDVELMQSTGLKDKNGVEIYEGDIVENIYKEIGFIKNCNDAFCFNRKERNFYLSGLGAGSPFEILGNIYENPELLEDE